MQQLDTIKQVKAYIGYICQHKKDVVAAWSHLKPHVIANGLLTDQELEKVDLLVIKHDGSKYNEDEFHAYRRYYYPNPKERPDTFLLEEAWQIHISKNPHHFENLRDYQGADYKCYVIEMFCDWIAMEKIYNQSAYDYYQANKELMNLPAHQAEFLETLMTLNRPKVRLKK